MLCVEVNFLVEPGSFHHIKVFNVGLNFLHTQSIFDVQCVQSVSVEQEKRVKRIANYVVLLLQVLPFPFSRPMLSSALTISVNPGIIAAMITSERTMARPAPSGDATALP